MSVCEDAGNAPVSGFDEIAGCSKTAFPIVELPSHKNHRKGKGFAIVKIWRSQIVCDPAAWFDNQSVKL